MSNIGLQPKEIKISVPGRICLFGEHQDYLGLPIIAAAINLRVSLKAKRRDDNLMRFRLIDLGIEETFNPNDEQPYRHNRDYLPSAMNVIRRDGFYWPSGYDVDISSQIPINSGASSSSALQVAYCSFLLAASGSEQSQDARKVATYAYRSEVVEFSSPGGMMDHFSTACGGVIWLNSREPYEMIRLKDIPGEFLLVDSGLAKDTNGVLGSVRRSIEEMNVDFQSVAENQTVKEVINGHSISSDMAPRLEANLVNKQLTIEAKELLSNGYTPKSLGNLLNKHHFQLSRNLGVSHPMIDELLELGIGMGAFGGKINGSGGGGSFFFYAGADGSALKSEFENRGYRSWCLHTDTGLQVLTQNDHKESELR